MKVENPETKGIYQLESVASASFRANGDDIGRCIVEIEYQNDYCYLIRYCDSPNGQCNIIKKQDERYFFLEC